MPVRGDLQVAKAMEVAQLANEGAFIGGTAAVTFAIVLVVRLLPMPGGFWNGFSWNLMGMV